MESVFIKVASFVCIILCGIIATRTGKLSSRTGEVLSKIVFTITLPAAIIHAFGAAEFTYHLLLLVPLGVACTAGPYALIFLATLRSSEQDRLLYLLNGIGYNIGNFALAFVQAFFPASTLVAACMFDAGNALMVTGGQYAITKVLVGHEMDEHPVRHILRKLFSSIPFDTYLVLIALSCAGVRIPVEVVEFSEPMANANSFLSMFMLGLMVRFSVNTESLGKMARLLGARLAMAVVMSLLVFELLPFELIVRCLVVTLLWAPVGSLGPVFTMWAGADHGLAGLINTVSIAIGVVAMTTCVVAFGPMI